MKLRSAVVTALAALAVVVTVATPALAQSPDAKKNADLEKKIATLLVDKLGPDAQTIRVTVVGDKVTLTGQVTERSTQEIADDVALFVDGVKKVDNQVKATKDPNFGTEKVKKELADSKLENAVESKVKGELGAHYKQVSIECTARVCSISGTVPDQARLDLAVKAAASVEGVKKVVALLKIKG